MKITTKTTTKLRLSVKPITIFYEGRTMEASKIKTCSERDIEIKVYIVLL
jgi:hypothetical protein